MIVKMCVQVEIGTQDERTDCSVTAEVVMDRLRHTNRSRSVRSPLDINQTSTRLHPTVNVCRHVVNSLYRGGLWFSYGQNRGWTPFETREGAGAQCLNRHDG